MHILLVNDDGIKAPGLKSLYNALKEHFTVTIVAPLYQKSGSGLATTLTKPLQIMEDTYHDGKKVYTVNGTPSDCVKLGLISLFKEEMPNLIVSGINHGSNAGKTVLYSGTIGGVIEGMFRNNIPGIAFSACDFEEDDYSLFEPFVLSIVQYAIKHPTPKGSFLNVNFPRKDQLPIKGVRLAKQGKSFWTDFHDRRIHPEGNPYYWLGGKWRDCQEEDQSDVSLLQKGYISISPIQVEDLTDHNHRQAHLDTFNDYFRKNSIHPENEDPSKLSL